jgi:hypothetical protein
MADAREPVVHRLLHTIRVASPCPVSWESMSGDDRIRACDMCAKKVYDLSAMTADEAEAALGDPAVECVRFFQRADGRVMTSDCGDWPRRRRQRRIATLAGVSLAAGMAGGVAAAWMMKPAPGGTSTDPPCAAEGVAVELEQPAPVDDRDDDLDEPALEPERLEEIRGQYVLGFK